MMRWLILLLPAIVFAYWTPDNTESSIPVLGDNETVFLIAGDNESSFYSDTVYQWIEPTPTPGSPGGGLGYPYDNPVLVGALDNFKRLYDELLMRYNLLIFILMVIIATIILKYVANKNKKKTLVKEYEKAGVRYE